MTLTPRNVTTLAVAALALLAAVDFWQRIFVPRQLEARPASSFVPATVPPPVTSSTIRKDLGTWLPKLQLIADAAPSGAVETGSALTLLAVFDEPRGRFAVVRATPTTGGAAQVRSVVEGDELSGFRVARIEPLRVVLAGPEGERALTLFKPKAEPVIGAGPVPGPAEAAPAGQAAGAPVASAAAPPPAVAASPPAPVSAAAAPSKATPAKPTPAGAKAVATQEIKQGQAFELPASMRGMKVIEAPSEGVVAKPGPPVAPPPSEKP
jgi:hypothetical protein